MEVVPEVEHSLAEEFLVEECLNYGNVLFHKYNKAIIAIVFISFFLQEVFHVGVNLPGGGSEKSAVGAPLFVGSMPSRTFLE